MARSIALTVVRMNALLEMGKVTVNMPVYLLNEVKADAERQGKSVSAWLAQAARNAVVAKAAEQAAALNSAEGYDTQEYADLRALAMLEAEADRREAQDGAA